MGSNVIQLFHGTDMVSAMDILNNGIDIFRSRADADFGYGFYTTAKREQAWQWAEDARRGEPAVVSFYMDISKLDGVYLSGNDWKEYIFQNRVYGSDPAYQDRYCSLDYVEGSMADGKPVRAALQYRSGAIDKKTFFKMLGTPRGQQLVLKSIKAVENVKFIGLDEREEESQ